LKTSGFSNDAEVAELVAAFESATIPASEFSHLAHIAVALSYLNDLQSEQALERMRGKIRAFAAHHGLSNLYHETLTTFWIKLLDHVSSNQDVDLPLFQRINAIVTRWGSSAPVKAHYSPEVIQSKVAREQWTPPDKLPLPF
jgi:hypothetical protein